MTDPSDIEGRDIRGRRLDHPAAEPLKAELLALDAAKPVTILTPQGDAEANTFAGMIRDLLVQDGRTVNLIPIRFDPPFRGLQLHDGDEAVQIAIGHR